MESFLKTGDWFLESGVRRVEPFKLPRRIYSLLNMFGWAIITLCPLVYQLMLLLLYGSTLSICIALSIIFMCKYFYTEKIIYAQIISF